MIRDRFAIGVTGLTVAALPMFALLAALESTRRPVDMVTLWLAGALQLGLLLTWIFIPRLPRWIIAGWGLILVAVGLGLIISAPISPGEGGVMPWGLIGLLIVGLVTMIVSAVHSGGDAPL